MKKNAIINVTPHYFSSSPQIPQIPIPIKVMSTVQSKVTITCMKNNMRHMLSMIYKYTINILEI